MKENSSDSMGFEYIHPCLGTGSVVPSGWQPITSLPIIIIVGVSGTGKTTFTNNLATSGYVFELLPDRRDLTNQLIIAFLQREDHQEVRTLPRMERVPYIRRYTQKYPAGLAYAISQLYVAPTCCNKFLLFNGLRGEKEVKYAVSAFPKAQFIVFDASDYERAKRLLKRKDPYDRTIKHNQDDFSFLNNPVSFDTLGVPEASAIFSSNEEKLLLEMARDGNVSVTELRDILQLLCVERSLYDKDQTIATLLSLASDRTLVVDTTTLKPEDVTKRIIIKFQNFVTDKEYDSAPKKFLNQDYAVKTEAA